MCDDHVFKDEKLFFRFRKDDSTYEEPPNATLLARGEHIYKRLVPLFYLFLFIGRQGEKVSGLIMIAQDT